MATYETFQYNSLPAARSGIPGIPYSPSPAIASPQTYFADFIPPTKLGGLQNNTYGTIKTSPVVVNVASNHGKLHKRVPQPSIPGKNKQDDSQINPKIALARARTPEASAGASPIDGPKSPSIRSTTRDILKQNLRKFSHHHEGSGLDNTIDLSRTAEENEQRSGLGITTSRSTSDIRNTTKNYRGHSRSHSHNSQISTTSGIYPPPLQYTLPIRDQIRSYTPPLARNYTASVDSPDFSGGSYADPAEDSIFRARGATIDSSNSGSGQRPKLSVNTSSTALPALSRPTFSQNPSMISLDRTSTRPRRSTNHSFQSGNPTFDPTTTPRSKAAADARAFSFLSKSNKDKEKEPEIDPTMTRVATIQAARQAFEDRQDYKTRKYEEKEHKEQERQQKKIAKLEERRRRKSDVPTSQRPDQGAITGAAVSPWDDDMPHPDFATSGEYASAESLPMPMTTSGLENANIGRLTQSDAATVTGASIRRPSKKHAARITYVQFATWVRTKFLNMGRRRRNSRHD